MNFLEKPGEAIYGIYTFKDNELHADKPLAWDSTRGKWL